MPRASSIGTICWNSCTLAGGAAELGTLTRQQVAALAGLAPMNRDSGKSRGKRSIGGGRGQVRRRCTWRRGRRAATTPREGVLGPAEGGGQGRKGAYHRRGEEAADDSQRGAARREAVGHGDGRLSDPGPKGRPPWPLASHGSLWGVFWDRLFAESLDKEHSRFGVPIGRAWRRAVAAIQGRVSARHRNPEGDPTVAPRGARRGRNAGPCVPGHPLAKLGRDPQSAFSADPI